MSKKPAPAAKKRIKKAPTYKSFKLSKKVHSDRPPLPGAFKLLGQSIQLIRKYKKLFLGITAVHVVLNIILVRGLGISNELVELKQGLTNLFGEAVNQVEIAIALFAQVAGSASAQANEAAGVYQMFLSLITSLAIIWAVRQVLAGHIVTTKNAYYTGLYPLVPFILVLLVIGLQLLPALIGNMLYSTAISNGLLVTGAEKLLALLFFLLLIVLSLYMVVSSVFALYIATLPDMTPLRALRSARTLVLNRRLSVGLRMIALPLMLLIVAMVTIVPLIIFAPLFVEPIFFVMSSLGLLIIHLYMYSLYRSLL